MQFVRISRDKFDAETKTTFEADVIRTQRKSRYVGTRNGSPAFSQMRIFLPADTAVLSTDRAMPDGTNELEILSYYPATDADGMVDHVEVDV
jgi:hypothetical protein